jgi:hypothetical protein
MANGKSLANGWQMADGRWQMAPRNPKSKI